MSLRYSKHGEMRAKQRGFSKEKIELIRRYGTPIEDREAEVYLVLDKDVDREILARKKRLRQIECDREECKREIQQLASVRP